MVFKTKVMLGLCLLGFGSSLAYAQTSTPAEQQKKLNSHELVILDGAVPQPELLRQGLRPGIEVVTLPSSGDPLSQLQTILADHHGLSALHLVSHGASGALQLGSSRLDERALQHHPEVAQALAAAVVPHGDLLLYGCDVAAGAAGKSFIKALRQQTGLNIAASDNLTGASALGGDWVLEQQVGRGTTMLALNPLVRYDNVLVSGTETFESIAPYAPEVTSLVVGSWTITANPRLNMGGVTEAELGSALNADDSDTAFLMAPDLGNQIRIEVPSTPTISPRSHFLNCSL